MDVLKLLAYNTWANRLVVAQIETFPAEIFERQFGGSFGSMKATLIHVLESDWIWFNRWKGIPLAGIPAWQFVDAKAIHDQWKMIQDEMGDIARTFVTRKDSNIDFVTRKGAPYTLPFDEIVAHITHHGSYHRGQLTHMIRMAGQQPVSTDYFIFCTR